MAAVQSATNRPPGRGPARPAGSRQTPLIIRWEWSTRPLAKRTRWCLPTASAAADAVAGEPLGDALARQPRLGGLDARERASDERGPERIAFLWLTCPSGTRRR